MKKIFINKVFCYKLLVVCIMFNIGKYLDLFFCYIYVMCSVYLKIFGVSCKYGG